MRHLNTGPLLGLAIFLVSAAIFVCSIVLAVHKLQPREAARCECTTDTDCMRCGGDGSPDPVQAEPVRSCLTT